MKSMMKNPRKYRFAINFRSEIIVSSFSSKYIRLKLMIMSVKNARFMTMFTKYMADRRFSSTNATSNGVHIAVYSSSHIVSMSHRRMNVESGCTRPHGTGTDIGSWRFAMLPNRCFSAVSWSISSPPSPSSSLSHRPNVFIFSGLDSFELVRAESRIRLRALNPPEISESASATADAGAGSTLLDCSRRSD